MEGKIGMERLEKDWKLKANGVDPYFKYSNTESIKIWMGPNPNGPL